MADYFDDMDLSNPVEVSETPVETTPKAEVEVVQENRESDSEESTQLIEISDEPQSENVIEQIEESLVKDKPKAKETKVKEEDTPENKPIEDEKKSSPWKIFGQALAEEGILSDFNETEFDDSKGAEALFETIKKEIVTNVETWKNSYSPEIKRILDAVDNGVSPDQAIQASTQAFMFSSIKEEALDEDENLCKQLIKEDMSARGYDEDQIKEAVQDAEDLGKLQAKAKTALKGLTKLQEAELREEEARAKEAQKILEEKNKKEVADRTKYIDELQEVIPGNKLNAQVKKKMMDSMFKTVKTEDGKQTSQMNAIRSKDPVKFDAIFHYLLVNGVFEGKFDSFKAPVQKSVIKNLKETIESDTTFKQGVGKVERNDKLEDSINSMKAFFKQ